MRQSLFALATAAFLLAACGGSPKIRTLHRQSTTVTASVGSPVTASGKMRIALLLPLSGRSAPIGQSLQQAAEMALFDTGAKELALAAYDSGETADTAVEAYRKARIDGAARCWGRCSAPRPPRWRPWWAKAAPMSCRSPTTSRPPSAASGSMYCGTAPVRRVVDHAVDAGFKRFAAFAPQTSYGRRWSRPWRAEVTIRGGKVAAVELFDANSADLNTPARRLAEVAGEDKLAVLVLAAPPRLSAALAALAAAGIDNKSVQLIGTGVWDVPNIGSEVMLRGASVAPRPIRPSGPTSSAGSCRPTAGRRIAWRRSPTTACRWRPPARLKQGGDFSEAAITNPNGWSGIDGIFRFLPNGRSERALAVIAVQRRGLGRRPGPTSFAAKPVN